MNSRSPNGFREFNPPAVIVSRLVFLLMILGLGAALVLLVSGSITHDLMHMGAGAILGTAAFLVYTWLRRDHQWTDVLESIRNFGSSDSPPTEFAQQVHKWEAMRIKRGTPEFDAWEFLKLQREIENQTKEDPQLAAFWHDRQD